MERDNRAAETVDPEHVDRVESAVRRNNAIIDDALFLAKDLAVEETESVDVQSLATQSWNLIDAPEASLVVDTPFRIDADPTLIQTLFENLFRNAIEHGGVSVTVRIGLLENGFYVADDGPGIQEPEHTSVFDVGYTSRSVAGNTGMGLSITKRVVMVHDWEIQATEGTTGGARFKITGVTVSK